MSKLLPQKMEYSRRNFLERTLTVATVGTLFPLDIILGSESNCLANDDMLKTKQTDSEECSLDATEKYQGTNLTLPIMEWKLGTSLSLTTPDIGRNMLILKKAGIDYVEVGMHSSKNMDIQEITTLINDFKNAADMAGITIWSIHIPFGWDFDISLPNPILRERSRQAILLTLKLAKGLGSYQKAILHPSFEPIDKELRLAHIASFRTCIKELGPFVEEKYKVRLAIECLPRTCLGNSAAEMITLVGDVPSVDVCMDTNHLLGEKTEYFAQKLNRRIQTIHVSDYDEINERHWLPGRGVINFSAVIDVLVQSGYKGPFMYEVSRNEYGDDMESFANDLVYAWEKIKKDYEANF